MESKAVDVELSLDESELLIRKGIAEAELKKKREITENNFPEFLGSFDALTRIQILANKLNLLPVDNSETNYERLKLEVELRSAQAMAREEIEKSNATGNNLRFIQYHDQMEAIEESFNNSRPPEKIEGVAKDEESVIKKDRLQLLDDIANKLNLDEQRKLTTDKFPEFLAFFEISNTLATLRAEIDIETENGIQSSTPGFQNLQKRFEEIERLSEEIARDTNANGSNPRYNEYLSEIEAIEQRMTMRIPQNKEEISLN